MDLIHYSFAPLVLFRVPYMFDLLPYYLSIANDARGVGIFELLVFQCFIIDSIFSIPGLDTPIMLVEPSVS